MDEDASVALSHLERSPSELDGLGAGCLLLFGPAANNEPPVAVRRQGECRPVMPIDRDRLL